MPYHSVEWDAIEYAHASLLDDGKDLCMERDCVLMLSLMFRN